MRAKGGWREFIFIVIGEEAFACVECGVQCDWFCEIFRWFYFFSFSPSMIYLDILILVSKGAVTNSILQLHTSQLAMVQASAQIPILLYLYLFVSLFLRCWEMCSSTQDTTQDDTIKTVTYLHRWCSIHSKYS